MLVIILKTVRILVGLITDYESNQHFHENEKLYKLAIIITILKDGKLH